MYKPTIAPTIGLPSLPTPLPTPLPSPRLSASIAPAIGCCSIPHTPRSDGSALARAFHPPSDTAALALRSCPKTFDQTYK
jgi:hypothetical protein